MPMAISPWAFIIKENSMNKVSMGMAICGEFHRISALVSTLNDAYVANNGDWFVRFTSVKLQESDHFCYLCILNDVSFIDPLECLLFCRLINQAGISYSLAYVDAANQHVIQLTNQDRAFFNPVVKQFFDINTDGPFVIHINRFLNQALLTIR